MILFLLFLGCEKEEIIPGIVNDLEFYCPDGNSASYFEGYMGEQKFCYFHDVDGYEIEISATAGFMTDGPSTTVPVDTSQVSNFRVWGNLGFRPEAIFNNSHIGKIPHLKHYVLIETPASPETMTLLRELIVYNLLNKGQLPLNSDQVERTEGFNIVFRFNDSDANVSRIFETSGGNQNGSFLEVEDIEITELQDGLLHYDITL